MAQNISVAPRTSAKSQSASQSSSRTAGLGLAGAVGWGPGPGHRQPQAEEGDRDRGGVGGTGDAWGQSCPAAAPWAAGFVFSGSVLPVPAQHAGTPGVGEDGEPAEPAVPSSPEAHRPGAFSPFSGGAQPLSPRRVPGLSSPPGAQGGAEPTAQCPPRGQPRCGTVRRRPSPGAQSRQVEGPGVPARAGAAADTQSSEAAGDLGSCQHVPPTLPASLCQPRHVPPGCQTLPSCATHPFYLWVEGGGLPRVSLQPGQGLETALGGTGDVTAWGSGSGTCVVTGSGPVQAQGSSECPAPLPTLAFSNATEVPVAPPAVTCMGAGAGPRRSPQPGSGCPLHPRRKPNSGGRRGDTGTARWWLEQNASAPRPPGEQQSLVFPTQGQGVPMYSSAFLPASTLPLRTP